MPKSNGRHRLDTTPDANRIARSAARRLQRSRPCFESVAGVSLPQTPLLYHSAPSHVKKIDDLECTRPSAASKTLTSPSRFGTDDVRHSHASDGDLASDVADALG